MTMLDKSLSIEDWLFWFKSDSLHQKQQDVLNFIFTWMKYNNWYSEKYKLQDRLGVVKLSENIEAQKVYETLRCKFVNEFKQIPCKVSVADRLGLYRGKTSKIEVKFNDEYNGFYDYLMIIYKIRCNFFHGSKEPSKVNIQLISWAGKTLGELLKELKLQNIID